MNIATEWKDYQIIATGDGYKLERWKDVILLRPDPQIIWKSKFDLFKYKNINAVYHRSNTGGGGWEVLKPMPKEWVVSYKDLNFLIKPMGFKHTGLFPEQAVNWETMRELIKKSQRKISVLNLFAYTGGATAACAAAGAEITHVDAAKAMVERAKENLSLSNLQNANVRYIVDDCLKFVLREIKRGKRYDAVIMDPPSFGRGPNGEVWKIEDNIYNLVESCMAVLTENPLFFLINSYTTGLQPLVLKNILASALGVDINKTQSYENGIITDDGLVLPCGASGIFIA